MPGSTRSTHRSTFPSTVAGTLDDTPFLSAALVARIFEGPALPSWEAVATSGPHDLYTAFGLDAAEEFVTSQFDLSDEQGEIITEAVRIALDVALTAAGVEKSWAVSYQRASAHLR